MKEYFDISRLFHLSVDGIEIEDKIKDLGINNLDDEDDDFIDENVVDLRSFSPMGSIALIELLELPPQQKKVNDWLMQQSECD